MAFIRFSKFYNPIEPYPDYRFQIPQQNNKPEKIIDIAKVYNDHKVPEDVGKALSQLIDKNIHEHLVRREFDPAFFERKGFSILKESSTVVLEHPGYLPGYLIKTAPASRNFAYMEGPYKSRNSIRTLSYTNLLRCVGTEKFRKKMEGHTDFEFPDEYLYCSPHASSQDTLNRRYYAISKKKEVYSSSNTRKQLQRLKTRDQVLLANRIIHFIKATGLLDFHSGNLVLKRDRSHFIFEVIDTEPLGLFVAGEEERRQGLIPRKYRVLIGLLNFRDLYCRKLPVFKQEAEKAIRAFLMENPDMQVRAEKPSSERWIMVAKIVFSFIIPLIPLLIFVWALIEECCCNFDNVSSTMPVRTHRSRSSPLLV